MHRRPPARKALEAVLVTNPLILRPLPRWIASGVDPSFSAGAATFALDHILRAEPAWLGCWRLRQALKAAAVAAKLLRLNADEAALRDAEHLTRPGDDPGPAGRLHRLFRQLAARPTRLAGDTLSAIAIEIEGAAASAEVFALLRADIALAERLGWERPLLLHLTVILDPGLKHTTAARRPRADSAEWAHDQHTVLARAAITTHADAVTLARKAAALMVAATSLRTRDGGNGVGLILSDDSVAPWRMVQGTAAAKSAPGKSGVNGLGSDRAARRLCESLHGLRALRLLTDRPTFRLYGL